MKKDDIKEYKKLKETFIKNTFDPVAKDTCLWSKEKAFRLIDYHSNNWMDINGSVLDVYHDRSRQSFLFLFFTSLFKEIYWIQLLFLWGNYRVINSNLRFILEEIALGSYVDREFSDLNLGGKIEKAIVIDEKRKYRGWKLFKLVLKNVVEDIGLKKHLEWETLRSIFWDEFRGYVHPKPIKFLEISQVAPNSFYIDTFNEDLAEECLDMIDTSFDFIYLITIHNFPKIVKKLRKKKKFIKDFSPNTYFYLFKTH